MFELQSRRERGDRFQLIDVREPWEADINQIEGAELIPLGELPDRLDELDPAASYVVHCKMGGRSANAVAQMQEAGFRDVVNLEGRHQRLGSTKSTPTSSRTEGATRRAAGAVPAHSADSLRVRHVLCSHSRCATGRRRGVGSRAVL